MRSIDDFTSQYKLSKTLRFELRPIGKTLDNFKNNFLAKDEGRAKAYPIVKKLLDQQHKALLERTLAPDFEEAHSELFENSSESGSKSKLMKKANWEQLASAFEEYRKSDKTPQARADLSGIQEEFRKILVARFKSDDLFKPLTDATPNGVFTSMKKHYEENGQALPDALASFMRFSCYFKGYQENRKNIYSDQAQVTAAANRAVNENFPRFLDNAKIMKHIASNYPELLADIENELSSVLHGTVIGDVFKIQMYGKYLSQSRIEAYNQIVGGYVPADREKIRGINEFINLFRQKSEAARSDRALMPLAPLYKQILSDRESLSFYPQQFENDSEVIEAVENFLKILLNSQVDGRVCDVVASLQDHLQTITESEEIWIDNASLSRVSKDLLGSWEALKDLMREAAVARFSGESTEKKREKAVEAWMKRDFFSLADLSGLVQKTDDVETPVCLPDLWRGDFAKGLFDKAKNTSAVLMGKCESWKAESNSIPLRERQDDVAVIKETLDALMDLLHFIKPLHVGAELERDEAFYQRFDSLYDILDGVVPLYNKIRNYMTRKLGDQEKIKLMFDNPTLADGWDQNKENDNKCVLFFRDGGYFLGVLTPPKERGKGKVDFISLAKQSTGSTCKKMVYKYLCGPNKMLPKVFFPKKSAPPFPFEPSLYEKYKKGLHSKQNASFDLAFCHELIDFFKEGIKHHPDWSKFNFKFSPTSKYQGIDEFYREISDQGYRITFDEIPVASIDQLVEEGKLCLFQIWNKDFSEKSTGTPNLHTLYWKALFQEENLKDVVLKLNGEAELFYRRRSIKKPFSHKPGEKMVNRRLTDGTPMGEAVHGEIFRHVNGCKDPLSMEAKTLLDSGKVVIKDVTHEIVKDARYTEDKFAFHVPISLNYKAPDKPKKFNDSVLEYLRDNPEVNIIGIDRGERHLLYLTLINQKGEILEQRTLNTVSITRGDGVTQATDYHAKLDLAEKDRAVARESWSAIGAIKDLKAGYLSVVVHDIAKMMIEHNAIVVLEDLNFGFKRGRFRIEKQVYQKFEKALIDKLNYLVFKNRGISEIGGVLHGYQLTDKFISFERLGKQTGFIFYVPAAYTSKIDPTTGFTNLFNTRKCTNAEGIKDFFNRFDSICYMESKKAFAFSFDYDRFKTSQESYRKKWTVYSAKRRLVYDKESRGEKEVNPTQILFETFAKRGVEVKDGFDALEYIKGIEPTRENATFFRSVFYAFDRTLQMRNSYARTGEDYIESPVENSRGVLFDSREAKGDLPQNADANGAYHIALKGLFLLKNRIHESAPLKIEHRDWFRFAQERANR